jgi:phospholipid transport system substrate-binding protein
MTPKFISRRLTLAALSLALAGGFGVSAAFAQGARDAGAEQFVQVQAQKVLTVLSDHGRGTADKIRVFRGLVDQIADVPAITNFVLGKYARSISPAQRAQFAPVFREYAQNVYESRLTEYHGETLRVTGSTMKKPGDVIVASQVSGGKLDKPLPVSWRVLNRDGGWKVVDVQVSGVWLAITQQQDFVSTIDNAGGNINVLIGQLQSQVRDQNGARR